MADTATSQWPRHAHTEVKLLLGNPKLHFESTKGTCAQYTLLTHQRSSFCFDLVQPDIAFLSECNKKRFALYSQQFCPKTKRTVVSSEACEKTGNARVIHGPRCLQVYQLFVSDVLADFGKNFPLLQEQLGNWRERGIHIAISISILQHSSEKLISVAYHGPKREETEEGRLELTLAFLLFLLLLSLHAPLVAGCDLNLDLVKAGIQNEQMLRDQIMQRLRRYNHEAAALATLETELQSLRWPKWTPKFRREGKNCVDAIFTFGCEAKNVQEIELPEHMHSPNNTEGSQHQFVMADIVLN